MVWVIFNRNDLKKTIKTDRFSELISAKETGYDVLNKIEVDISENITITGKSAMILEIN